MRYKTHQGSKDDTRGYLEYIKIERFEPGIPTWCGEQDKDKIKTNAVCYCTSKNPKPQG